MHTDISVKVNRDKNKTLFALCELSHVQSLIVATEDKHITQTNACSVANGDKTNYAQTYAIVCSITYGVQK